MAGLMQTQLNIAEEELITQGDDADKLYILYNGSVTVFLNYDVGSGKNETKAAEITGDLNSH